LAGFWLWRPVRLLRPSQPRFEIRKIGISPLLGARIAGI
jgi:hypothetical protein